ncbi:MAG: PA14 domain-containing protein, partial [Caldilinea sp.]
MCIQTLCLLPDRIWRRVVQFVVVLWTGVWLVGVVPAEAQPAGATWSGAGWQASYWNNRSFVGAPALTRIDAAINFSWGVGSPAPEIAADNFAARWTRTLEVTEPGRYRFTLNSDDGSRLFIDDQLLINAWYDHGVSRTFSATLELAAGSHDVRVEYYERRGAATVRLGWAEASAEASAAAPLRRPSPATDQIVRSGQWRGEYYQNRSLLGAPVLVREEPQVDFDWGMGSPAAGLVGADAFSVRWTNTVNFPKGIYRFRATVDDGVRVFVDDQLV